MARDISAVILGMCLAPVLAMAFGENVTIFISVALLLLYAIVHIVLKWWKS